MEITQSQKNLGYIPMPEGLNLGIPKGNIFNESGEITDKVEATIRKYPAGVGLEVSYQGKTYRWSLVDELTEFSNVMTSSSRNTIMRSNGEYSQKAYEILKMQLSSGYANVVLSQNNRMRILPQPARLFIPCD